jgi:hypothetical protein
MYKRALLEKNKPVAAFFDQVRGNALAATLLTYFVAHIEFYVVNFVFSAAQSDLHVKAE